MIAEWFAERRRKRIREEEFPAAWIEILERNVVVYSRLTEDERTRLREDLHVLIEEKYWEGCGGLELTDEIKVTIAAQAALLILNREHDYYNGVESILVYPHHYHSRDKNRDGSGVVRNVITGKLGEAWSQGPVVLSWFDSIKGGSNPDDGRNVVYHEFAHKLDLEDGDANGVPPLDDERQVEEWADVMQVEYEHHVALTEKNHATLIDAYGATNAAEFFAVTTECFFEKSVQLQHQHPRLYHVLRGYYRQDPASRV